MLGLDQVRDVRAAPLEVPPVDLPDRTGPDARFTTWHEAVTRSRAWSS